LILTLTANPAIDRTVTVDRWRLKTAPTFSPPTNRPRAGHQRTCVLHAFGGETLAVVTSGGNSGNA